jgi:hypothetical protein
MFWAPISVTPRRGSATFTPQPMPAAGQSSCAPSRLSAGDPAPHLGQMGRHQCGRVVAQNDGLEGPWGNHAMPTARHSLRAGLLLALAAAGIVMAPPGAWGSRITPIVAGATATQQQPTPGYNPDSSPAPDTDTVVDPSADVNLVGPPATAAGSPVLAAVIHAWTTMTSTIYSHHDVVNTAAGTYQFDCVGATNYFLAEGAPAANLAMRTALGIKADYVPRPAAMASYFAQLPSQGNGHWTPVRQLQGIGPGDIIAVPPAPGTTEAGHALIVAGNPITLANGDVAVLVYDSTATPHGPSDTRNWDPRNKELAPTTARPEGRPSGLGQGTVMIAPTSTGAPGQLHWSVGGVTYGATVEIAMPIS